MTTTVSTTGLASNALWIADTSMLDVLLADSSGQIVGQPTLTIVIDAFSRCIASFHLGLEKFEVDHLVAALQHAIRQKSYAADYGVERSWVVYGVPCELRIEDQRILQSRVFTDFVKELNIRCSLESAPANFGAVERLFGQVNRYVCPNLPGFVSRPIQAGADAIQSSFLTLQELEKVLIKYFCDNYNQQIAPEGGFTRSQKWLSGFEGTLPEIVQNQ